MKNKIIIISSYLLAALLYIIGPYTLFKVCEVGDSPMKCHWSIQAEAALAIVLIGTAIVYVLTKTAREKVFLSIIAVFISITAILIPLVLIGGCSMKSMACQSSTFPALYVISIILILVSIINIIIHIRKIEGNS
jgi:hypothetical protein